MHGLIPYTLNIQGRLMDLSEPKVMGILNVTPDSFYAQSRSQSEREIKERADELLAQGADIIDVGACSSRPGAEILSAKEEMERLKKALTIIREHHPKAVLSVDTYQAEVARMCVEQFGVDIVNDISGGDLDADMFATVADLGVPYILTHTQGSPKEMQQNTHYGHLIADMMKYFSERIVKLHELGLKDIVLDPGFGFAKTLQQNYQLMNHLGELKAIGLPLLVGISRKSMIYKLLETTPTESLNGTTVLNTIALLHGANILRVHDVKACVETLKIVRQCLHSESKIS